jgi:tetratricopeptide (TPR) repeat protein
MRPPFLAPQFLCLWLLLPIGVALAQPTTRSDALEKYATSLVLQGRHADAVNEIAVRLRQLGREPDRQVEARLTVILSCANFQTGSADAGKAALTRAHALSKELESEGLDARLFEVFASLTPSLFVGSETLHWLRSASAVFSTSDDNPDRDGAEILRLLGRGLLSRRDGQEEGAALLERYAQQARRIDGLDFVVVAEASAEVAKAQARKGDGAAALALMLPCIAEAARITEVNSLDQLIGDCWRVSDTLSTVGQFDSAIALIDGTLEVAKARGRTWQTFHCQWARGRAYWKRRLDKSAAQPEDAETAISSFRQAVAIFNDGARPPKNGTIESDLIDARTYGPAVQTELANMLVFEHRYPEAIEMARRAVATATELRDGINLPGYEFALAKMLLRAGEFDSAARQFQRLLGEPESDTDPMKKRPGEHIEIEGMSSALSELDTAIARFEYALCLHKLKRFPRARSLASEVEPTLVANLPEGNAKGSSSGMTREMVQVYYALMLFEQGALADAEAYAAKAAASYSGSVPDSIVELVRLSKDPEKFKAFSDRVNDAWTK